MKLLTHFLAGVIFYFMATSCQSTQSKNEIVDTLNNAQSTETSIIASKSTNCYLSAFNRDTTFVSITIDGDTINGTMNWIPYEKDGARGTLAGKKNNKGEFELLYSYMIEGSNQTETKVMKVEGNKLLIKEGELVDPKNDGHLIYKDVNTATYKDTLSKIDCK
jgi:hypothetical protein